MVPKASRLSLKKADSYWVDRLKTEPFFNNKEKFFGIKAEDKEGKVLSEENAFVKN